MQLIAIVARQFEAFIGCQCLPFQGMCTGSIIIFPYEYN